MLAALVAVGSVLPAGISAQDRAQDSVTTSERGWIGIRFTTEKPLSAPTGQWSVQLMVADVHRNSPADKVGIVPGDWFVSVDGNLLSTYETWLRLTSNLGVGQHVRLRVVRSGSELEVAVIADLAPEFIGPNRLDELAGAFAHIDSVFGSFLDFPFGIEPFRPWFDLPAGARRLTEGEVATQGIRRAPTDSETGAEVESPPSVGGGGTELTTEVYIVEDGRFSILTPQLFESTVLLGGVWVRDLTADLGRYFGVETGVLVTDVSAMTPGFLAGFRSGDVIVSVEEQTFASVNDFRRLLAASSTPIELVVIRDKEPVKIIFPRPER